MDLNKDQIMMNLKNKIDSVKNLEDFKVLKSEFLGKKGQVTQLMKNISKIDKEKKKEYGQKVNQLKSEIEDVLNSFMEELNEKKKKSEELKDWVDVTVRGAKNSYGKEHLINKTIRESFEIFTNLGFTVVEGNEIEEPWFNFDALNTPEWHPARDMQDTFYLNLEKTLLRTHTSGVQIRTMTKMNPPIAVVSSGRVYRKDEIDATHSAMFYQLEGLFIDKKVTVGNLRKFLEIYTKKMFGDSLKVLLRPSYFPFVEPGFEVDVSCINCGGKGCSVCKNTGWIEVLGAGLVHPNVLKNVGFDPDEWQGLAFGVGVERIAMLKYGVSNMREFFKNDIRFVE
ncbi:phenylalanyl-tRNA synthetase alpha subunit [Oceanotoga teriensis]|uniref:Phenylalanine--tRNA ligase alpha subunit n=1 Tax=Oceanotoga teriensis TaxID=515440 RepID=A0AA45HHR8_9BACT|nr:phenylalanine--tRNA ligase subunit alpha [Oceanotoga teriensis]PWJ88500.1 phenylalanyl-tRNA synthetase alpha subunit [Oceanotoga teriensis]